MAELVLREYYKQGNYYVPGDYYYWRPLPKSVSKNVEVVKRLVHRGRRKLKKYKYRVRETLTFTLSGSCPSEQVAGEGELTRRTIEFLSKRDSKFEIIMNEDTPEIFKTPDPDNINSNERIFVVFKNVSFSISEGKHGWYDYHVELERVNCEGISGIQDPWLCK